MTPVTRTPARSSAPRGLLGVLLVLVLTGCSGLRLETEPPPPPVPDAQETVRQRAALDARTIADLAEQVSAAAADPAVAASVTSVASASRAHLDALGGVYEPPVIDGRSPASAPPEAGPTATPTAPDGAPAPEGPAVPAPGPAELVALLAETSASARADAETTDGRLARLLASVAVARRLLADGLAASAGLPPADAAATAFTVPEIVPPGVDELALVPLIQSEDALGLAWEVVAARSQGDARAAAAARAEQHRGRARQWAAAGGVAGTAADPRRVAYDLPPEVTGAGQDPAVTTATLGGLEAALSASYASLVALAEPGSRSELADAMLDAAREEAALLGVTPTFPGAPDLAVPAT